MREVVRTREISEGPSIAPRNASPAILAIDTGMIGFLAANAPALSAVSKWMELAGRTTSVLIAVSIVTLYRVAFRT